MIAVRDLASYYCALVLAPASVFCLPTDEVYVCPRMRYMSTNNHLMRALHLVKRLYNFF